jgi:hypothetical protein
MVFQWAAAQFGRLLAQARLAGKCSIALHMLRSMRQTRAIFNRNVLPDLPECNGLVPGAQLGVLSRA